MDWLSLLVSVAVSALVSLLLGRLRAKWEDAARRDLAVRREISGHLRGLILSLRRDLQNRQILKSGGSVPPNELLTKRDVEKTLWRIVRALDSPDLNPKARNWLYDELKRIAGPTIEVLQTCPSESSIGQGWEVERAVFVQYVRGHGRTEEFPLD